MSNGGGLASVHHIVVRRPGSSPIDHTLTGAAYARYIRDLDDLEPGQPAS